MECKTHCQGGKKIIVFYAKIVVRAFSYRSLGAPERLVKNIELVL